MLIRAGCGSPGARITKSQQDDWLRLSFDSGAFLQQSMTWGPHEEQKDTAPLLPRSESKHSHRTGFLSLGMK
jgi:hypothetical protein